jgi:probable rRNA maturation factor
MAQPALKIVLQRASESGQVPSDAKLRRWLRAALVGQAGEITLRIVDAAESAELNERFRDRKGPTNVLSFPAEELPAYLKVALRPLGDLVVCAPVVEQEASAQGKSLDAHWAHMLVHGALHVLGYDHESGAEAEQMEGRECEILDGLGFPDPYR